MVGEGHFITYAARQGWDVYRGLDGHTAYDFIVDTPDGLRRVEVKRVDSVTVSERGHVYNTVTKLRWTDYDLLYVSTPTGDYLIPASVAPATTLAITVPGRSTRRTKPGKWEAFRVERG
jgi:hypothetical protein